jgi:hypothetical protein
VLLNFADLSAAKEKQSLAAKGPNADPVHDAVTEIFEGCVGAPFASRHSCHDGGRDDAFLGVRPYDHMSPVARRHGMLSTVIEMRTSDQ